jgi:hypothetical protein
MQNHLSRFAPVALAGVVLSGVASAQQEPESPWSFFGQARLRAEFNDTNNGTSDRHRQRLRLRAGANYMVNEELTLTARASTGDEGNPNSGYHDIGKGFNRMEFSLDQLFVAYTPDAWGGAKVVAGKFANPVYRTPFYSELVWDGDLMPEGAALIYPLEDLGPFDSSTFTVAYTAVIEQAAAEDSWANMWLWHGVMSNGEDSQWDFGANYYFYGDLSPDNSTVLVGTGNAVSGGDFASDFGVVQGTVGYQTGDLLFAGEYVLNTRAADGIDDSGFALGAGIDTDYGRFYVQHQTLGQDATVAATAQDDFLYRTNYSTNIVGWKKDLGDNVGLHVWLQASELDEDFGAPDDTVYRFRIDFDVNF